MKLKEKKVLIQKLIRYLANSLLVLSIVFLFIGLWFRGTAVFSELQFWVTINSLWQVVIMLILVENFYLIKKK